MEKREKELRMLSAYHGLDPIPALATRLCGMAPVSDQDGMPVTFSVQINGDTVSAAAFAVENSSGEIVTPICATLRPAFVFSDYYGSQAKYELQTYAGEAGPVRGVSLLELQMMRDIGRIVSAWGGTSGSNPDVRSPTILNNHLRCYCDSRESFDSPNESISKMHECIYTVLSDANWILNKEVDQALENLAQTMRARSPGYQAIRMVAPQVTQQ